MSEHLKKLIFGICVLTFLILTFGIGPTNIFGLEQLIQKQTNYFFGVTIDFLDYALIAFIPFFAVILNSKRAKFRFSDLMLDMLIIVFWAVIAFVIGLYVLTFIGKPSNPLIPQYLLIEPISVYSALCIGIGIGIPFLARKRSDKINEIDQIGTEL